MWFWGQCRVLTLWGPISTYKFSKLIYTFPLRISWQNLIKYQGIFTLVIILTSSLDDQWILLRENWCCSLFGLEGLKALISTTVCNCATPPPGHVEFWLDDTKPIKVFKNVWKTCQKDVENFVKWHRWPDLRCNIKTVIPVSVAKARAYSDTG